MQARGAQKKIRVQLSGDYFFFLILRDLIEFFSVYYYFIFLLHNLFIYLDL